MSFYDQILNLDPFRAFGMRVIEAPPGPQKIKLSESVTCSDEFREEMNDYLLARFGRIDLLGGDTFLVSKHFGSIVVPEGMARIIADTSV